MFGLNLGRSRFYLVVILAFILSIYVARMVAQGLWSLEEPEASSETDFTLEIFGEPGGIAFEEGLIPNLPTFDAQSDNWDITDDSFEGFVPLIRGMEVGPHGSSPFLVVNLPEKATIGEYRQAIASLARHGICRVGVYRPIPDSRFSPNGDNPDWPLERFVSVYRVLNVKEKNSTSKPCVDRFPAWHP